MGDDFAWAVWYAVWRVRGEDGAEASATREALDRFDAALGCVPQLDEPLRTVADYLRGIGPRADAADALLRVSEWALERGADEPAIQCAEAAAALVPESARRALAAGRANRIFSQAARAALYYERAMTLARLRRQWRTYVRAHVGLGQVKKALGEPAAARAHYYTAARAARSLSGEKWLAAQTRHDLLVLAAEEGAFDEALRHARQALEWYPRHHSRLPALVHDFGFLLMRLHLYAPAVPLLASVMRASIPPQDQVIGWSTLARAAAGTADESGYRAAAEEVLRRVGLFDVHAAAAFENLAFGAHLLELWELAEQYATRSIEISTTKAQNESLNNARRVLTATHAKAVLSHRSVDAERLRGPVADLSREMASRLAAWRGSTWKRKHQYGPERWKSSQA
ncbi:MAG: tetratricopeptide repeat protein [Gemmatimonadetes bacterium]|nr:tetratricopeptide repeat protein [Gemmatimonadota bacterium]